MTDGDGWGLSRRQFLRSAGVGAVAAVAGCSGGGETDGPAADEAPTATATPGTESPRDTGSTAAPSNEAGTDPNQTAIEDRVEARYERLAYEWIEFDDPRDQLSVTDAPESDTESADGYDLLVDAIRSEDARGEDVDAVYLLVGADGGGAATPAGDGYRLGVVVVSASREFESFDGFTAVTGEGPYSRRSVERFFESHVSGYTETSDGFPEDVRELAGGLPQCLC